ncbi:MAG: 2-phosphosulfolactate phosphatase [Ktedonobacteraceae bacterium]
MQSHRTYRCHLDWGRHGAREAAERGDIVVIVDTLRFSTTAITAVHNGALVYPCALDEDPRAFARQMSATTGKHMVVPEKGRYSLSPVIYMDIEPGTHLVLASPNGGACTRAGRLAPYLFIGALVNAEAVATAVSSLLETQDLAVTVIACGERWKSPGEDGMLRVAIEDYLGAGAILSYIQEKKSPEAMVAEGAYRSASDNIEGLLWECESGRELRELGLSDDVSYTARLNLCNTAPVLRGERLEKFVKGM